ncbi:MAG TPA: hypothetical protein VFF06_03870 [Polyangia bacterium]|nr:hypothetical protein [Polyangia bacterium]
MPYRDAGAGPLGCARHPFTVGEHACAECGARCCVACASFRSVRVRCAACVASTEARRRRRADLMLALALLVGCWLPLGAGALIYEHTRPPPPRPAFPYWLASVSPLSPGGGSYAPHKHGPHNRRCCRCLGCWDCRPPSIINVQPSVWRQPPAPHPLAAFAKPSRPIF